MKAQDFENTYPAFTGENTFGTGDPNDAYARYFTGDSFLHLLTAPGVGLPVANVTFAPGCRNFWHIHHAASGGGQLLLCTAGAGWYQAKGEAPVALRPGSVVVIPAGVEHWHGAAKEQPMAHIAIELPGTDCHTEWGREVTAEEYDRLA